MELPIPDADTGAETTVRYAAVGRCCLECREGTRRGMPYMDDEQVEKAATESETFRESALMMSDIHAGRLKSQFDGMDSVSKETGVQDRLVAAYDGFTGDQFMEGSEGVPPSEVGVPGFLEHHPRTGDEETMFFVQAFPAFRLELSRVDAATHRRNEMPNQLYATQARDTVDFWKTEMESTLRSEHVQEPPTRMEVAKALAAVHRRKGTGTGSGSLLQSPSLASAPASASLLAATGGARIRNATPPVPRWSGSSATATAVVPPSPQAASPTKIVTPVVRNLLARPGVVTAHPQTISPRPRAASPSAFGSPKVQSVLSQNFPSQPPCVVAKPGAAAQPAALPKQLPLKRSPPVSGRLPASAKARVASLRKEVLSQPSLTAESLARLQGTCPLPGAPSAPSEMSDESSLSELRNVPVEERVKLQHPLAGALQGVNQVEANTKLQRIVTYNAKRGISDVAQSVSEHQHQLMACAELVMERLVAHNWEAIEGFIDVVVPKGMRELPKKNVTEIACRRAYAFMPPFVQEIKWESVFETISLHKTVEKPGLELKKAVVWTSFMLDEDLISGAPCLVVVDFIEKYMFGHVFAMKDPHQGRRLAFHIAEKWTSTIGTWPDRYKAPASPIRHFLERLKCVAWLTGQLPGQLNSTIANVEQASKGNAQLMKTISDSPWGGPLLKQAWMLDASESPVWPLLQTESKRLASEIASEQDKGISTMTANYADWKLAVRDTAFPLVMREPIIAIIQKRLASASLAEKNEDQLSADDPELNALLQHVRGMSTCFSDVRITMALAAMKPFASVVSKSKVYVAFKTACVAFMQVDLDDKGDKGEENRNAVREASAALSAACPNHNEGMLITNENDKQVVSTLLCRLGGAVLRAWPAEPVGGCEGLKALLKRIAASAEVHEPSTLDEQHGAHYQDGQAFVKATANLETSLGLINSYENSAPTLTQRVDLSTAESIIASLLKSLDDVIFEKFPSEVQRHLCKASLDDMLARATTHTTEYRAHVIAKAQEPLEKARHALEEKAYGATGQKRWDKVAQADGCAFKSFDDLLFRTTATLQQVNRSNLVRLIKNCHVVLLDSILTSKFV